MKKLPMVSLVLGLACSAALLGETIVFRHIASNTPKMHKFSHMIPEVPRVPSVHPGEQASDDCDGEGCDCKDALECGSVVMPEMKIVGHRPTPATKPVQQPKSECHLQALEQGGSPDRPFVLVCEM